MSPSQTQTEMEYTLGIKMHNDGDIIRNAHIFLQAGPGIVNITLGSRGSFMCYRRNERNYYMFCPAIAVDAKDVTGCGDSFSAGYLWSYLVTNNPLISCCAANIVAGLNTRTVGLSSIRGGFFL